MTSLHTPADYHKHFKNHQKINQRLRIVKGRARMYITLLPDGQPHSLEGLRVYTATCTDGVWSGTWFHKGPWVKTIDDTLSALKTAANARDAVRQLLERNILNSYP